MADRDYFLVRIELAKACRYLAHRHELRALDAGLLVLPGLAHVEQQRLGAARVAEPGGQLRGRELFHAQAQNLKRGGCSALTSGAITVSKRSTLAQAPGAVQLTSRAVMAGASPPPANNLPPAAGCSRQTRRRTALHPGSSIPTATPSPAPPPPPP